LAFDRSGCKFKPDDVVGPVLSIVIALEVEVNAFAGLASDVEFKALCAFMRGCKEPSLHDVTARVIEVPELELGENTHPVDVPAFSKSAASIPVREELKEIE
jgi:hypothetical protein